MSKYLGDKKTKTKKKTEYSLSKNSSLSNCARQKQFSGNVGSVLS